MADCSQDMHMNDLLSLGSFISSRIWTPDQTDQVSDLEDAIELFEELAMVTFRYVQAPFNYQAIYIALMTNHL